MQGILTLFHSFETEPTRLFFPLAMIAAVGAVFLPLAMCLGLMSGLFLGKNDLIDQHQEPKQASEELTILDFSTTSTSSTDPSITTGSSNHGADSTLNEIVPSSNPPKDQNETRSRNVTDPPKKKTVATDDLICPITLELLFDPVTAEDGRVYERAAIQKHIRTSIGILKSPLTNEPMGSQLLPATQMKNLIQMLIKNGHIEGELAVNWAHKKKQKTQVVDLFNRANAGDRDAMYQVARLYNYANDLVGTDQKKAFIWYEKAKKKGCIKSTSKVGELLLKGAGTPKDFARGVMMLTIAAEKGSDFAAYELGINFAQGTNGFQFNLKEAQHWLERSLNDESSIKHMNERCEKEAKELLERVVERLGSESTD
jgi:U-box domain/Sel1 repeat